jgi:hypothetical protein
VGFRRRPRSPLVCNSANRDVTVDDIGACGSKVLIVNRMNTDTYVSYGVNVISAIGAKTTRRHTPTSPPARSCASRPTASSLNKPTNSSTSDHAKHATLPYHRRCWSRSRHRETKRRAADPLQPSRPMPLEERRARSNCHPWAGCSGKHNNLHGYLDGIPRQTSRTGSGGRRY